VAELCSEAGASLVVDGTWTTPLLQRPLDLGADLVVHSLTKYISGHSDVLGGAVLSALEDTHFERISDVQIGAGAVLDPFSSWLTLRGMRSLGVRITHQCASASTLAGFLTEHPRVKSVHYPGLSEHPGHETARSQMTDFGAMLSLQIDGSRDDAIEIAARTRMFTRATSLGGTESLIEHRASMEGPGTSTPENLLRLSIGLEFADDLLEDLTHALA